MKANLVDFVIFEWGRGLKWAGHNYLEVPGAQAGPESEQSHLIHLAHPFHLLAAMEKILKII